MECVGGVLCPPGFDCVVECTGSMSCREAIILCPDDYDCTIRCGDDAPQSCNSAVFQCSEQGHCDLLCAGQMQACKDSTLNCGLDGCTAVCLGADGPEVNCSADLACSCPDPGTCPP